MGKTSIEWSEMTWNPVRGCTKITPGCKFCYAATFAERWRGIPGHAYEQGFDLRLVPEKLTEPLRWRNPRTVFVNSMSDLFHGKVPDGYIAKVWNTMYAADWHVYQLLTKRAKRMRRMLSDWETLQSLPLPNVWLGVSVEDRDHGLPRIEELRETPAAVRFLSIEPLLEDIGELDLSGIHGLYIALAVVSWIGTCRLVRAEVMKIRELEYVLAARAIGTPGVIILSRHVLRNVAHLGIINLSLGFVGAVKAEVILSYIGLGVPVGTPSWGSMINAARMDLFMGRWWELTSAVVAMFFLVLAFNVFGDRLRDALDPRLRNV